MNEELLFAYLQEHGPFAEWVALYPLLADRVVSALITLNASLWIVEAFRSAGLS
jgi:hypothetical protein